MKRATQNPSSTNTPTRVSMRRGKKYCSIVRPYINLLATIEQIVFNLSEKNIDASVEQIMKLFDTNTPYSFNIIINNLIYNVFHSRQNFADLYLKYIKLIQIKEEKLCKNNLNITNCFFEYVSQKKSQEAFYLIKKMYDTNFIDTNIIKTVISKYVSDYKKVIYDILKHDSMCVENYQERRKEAWKKKKELFLEGTNQNEIGKIIQNDEIEKLQEISSQTNFDFNKRILLLPPIGELYGYEFINHNIVRLIDYAAFFGSVKCFKYLLLNGSDSYNAGKYAVASGNEEIIHLCEQNHSSFKESYEAAIEFHRNDIFKYIYEKNLEKFDDKNINNLARLCIKYENYVILSFLNKKGFKIDDSIINESSRNGNLYLVKYYLQYSEIPKESLILSTKANNIELVKFIIDQEGFFNTKNDEETVLHIATKNNNVEMVKLFLDKGIDVNTKYKGEKRLWNKEETTLHIATKNNNVEIVKLLLDKGIDVNAKYEKEEKYNDGYERASALHIAVKKNNLEIVKLLIDKGIEVNTLYEYYRREYLGTDIYLNKEEQEYFEQAIALHFAVKNNNLEIVKLLIEKGSDIHMEYRDDRWEEFGKSVLEIAVDNENIEIVKFLLNERGSDFSAVSYLFALDQASLDGNTEIVKLLLEQEKIDINAVNDYDVNTALFYASDNGYVDIVKLLLEQKIFGDINAKDDYGKTALIWASEKGHTEIVKLLLEQEVIDINAKDNDENTALLWASENGHIDIVKLLLEQKEIDINAKNKDGKTALMYANQKGYTEIIELLKKE